MPKSTELGRGDVYRRCDPDTLGFETTAELDTEVETVGQARAIDALRFGIEIAHEGYHLFALGANGAGKHAVVRGQLTVQAQTETPPDDWCYVHDFAHPHRPSALRLPTGRAVALRDQMSHLVEDLRSGIVAAFETEEYRTQHQEIEEEFSERQRRAFADIRQRAATKQIAVIHGPTGVGLAPMREGEVIDTEAFQKLPETEQQRLREAMSEFEIEIERVIRELPAWRRETQHKLRALKEQVTRSAVVGLIDDLKELYRNLPDVHAYLEAVERDVVENAEDFRRSTESEHPSIAGIPLPIASPPPSLRRYEVNVLNDRDSAAGAPVVYEDNPTYQNLVGRIEHQAQMGALVTDFTLIKAGALHRANGGYLILDAHRLLMQPFAWEGLKQALRSREIRTESLGQMLSIISTVSLEPQPIPLDTKVVLIGERRVYYLMYELDPEFRDLFKVSVDFEDDMPRDVEGDRLYARWIATIIRNSQLKPFHRDAVARVIERSARLAGSSDRLTTARRDVSELLREADHWATRSGRALVAAADVQRAIEARERRSDRVRTRVQEEIARGTLAIDTQGAVVGQVNGLSVIDLGGFAFGRPTRITARARLGSGRVIDIEREVELGGPLHSKGVLILSGFLSGCYLLDQPLSLAASLVFEQSYGAIDGDSASSAELYALLSALADLPISQALAVTGSVDQHGRVQAIGGVNEKIEGFFDICAARGLTGAQGVLIPASNVRHLMLKAEVAQAIQDRRFHIHPVASIDEGLELLTGVPAGRREAGGEFTPTSVHGRVEARLASFAQQVRRFRIGSEEEPT